MKKSFFKYLTMSALAVLSAGMTSCTSDDDIENDVVLTIDQSIVANDLEVDLENQVCRLPVTANDDWIAYVENEDDARWINAHAEKVVGEGDGYVILNIANNPTGADRKAVVTIASLYDDKQVQFTVRQSGYSGDDPTNSGQFFEAFSNQGIGYGANYDYIMNKEFLMKEAEAGVSYDPFKIRGKNTVFNVSQIQDISNSKKASQYNSIYNEVVNNAAAAEDVLLDSMVKQNKNFSAQLDMSISFGCLELEANFAYHAAKREEKAYVDYTINRQVPYYNVWVSPAMVRAYSVDWKYVDFDMDDDVYETKLNKLMARYSTKYGTNPYEWTGVARTKFKELEAQYSNSDFGDVFSPAFKSDYNKLMGYVINEKYDDANSILETMDQDYGPFIITGGVFGGLLHAYFQVDTLRLEGKDSIDASLQLAIGGALNVGGEVSYKSEGANAYHDIKYKVAVYGGEADRTVGSITRFITSSTPDNFQALQDSLSYWLTTIKGSSTSASDIKQSKAAPVSYTYAPIWTLMAHENTSNYVREWFIKRYESRGIKTYLGICDSTKTESEIKSDSVCKAMLGSNLSSTKSSDSAKALKQMPKKKGDSDKKSLLRRKW